MHRLRSRFWFEAIAGVVCAAAFLLTLAWPEWIEEVLRVDPDGGSGAVEWLLVAGLAIVALAASVAARTEWRRARRA